jgi:hypothetical protein
LELTVRTQRLLSAESDRAEPIAPDSLCNPREAASMARKPDEPDRDLSRDDIDSLDADALRALLAREDAAELFDAETRARIGHAIARGARRPPPPSVPQQQQMQQQEQRPAPEEGENEE